MQRVGQKFLSLVIAMLAAGQLFAASETPAHYDSPAVTAAATFDWSAFIQPPPGDADAQSRLDFENFTEALANESFAEAEIAAKQAVAIANADVTTDGYGRVERARALHNLAVTQQANGNYASAKQNYVASVNAIATRNDNLNPSLIMPLRGLATAFLATDQPSEAFAALDRALHVSNVNDGPHSLEQLPILDAKLQYHLEQNEAGQAIDVLERMNLLYTRQYPRRSPELLPALYMRAEVYAQLDMPREEYRAWRQILFIKREHSDDDLELIEPNIRIAKIMFRGMRKDAFRSVSTSTAEKHLKKALEIAEDRTEVDWQVRKDCLLTLADFYTLFDMKGRARRYYSAAWELLSSNEAYLPERDAEFAMPVPISQPDPDPYANFEYRSGRDEDDEDYVQGDMTLQFTVDDRGRTRDLRVVQANPQNFSEMEKRVHNTVEEFIYRPRYLEGEPVATEDQVYALRYYYLPDEYRSALEKGEKRGNSGYPR